MPGSTSIKQFLAVFQVAQVCGADCSTQTKDRTGCFDFNHCDSSQIQNLTSDVVAQSKQ